MLEELGPRAYAMASAAAGREAQRTDDGDADSPYATGVRWALGEERRRDAKIERCEEPDEPYEGHGVRIRAWWYCWLDGLDLRGDVNDMVFLEDNMPPELREVPASELGERGVRQIPGETVFDLLIEQFVNAYGIVLSPAGQRAFIEGYMSRITEAEERCTGAA